MRRIERYHPYFAWVRQAWGEEFPGQVPEPPGGWDAFHDWLFRGKLVGFFHREICRRGVEDRYPESFTTELRKDRYHIYANGKLLEEFASEVCGAVNREGLRAVPMRGIWLNRNVYEDAGLRRTTDVDIFVPSEAVRVIEDFLAPRGYRRAGHEYRPVWQEVFKKKGSLTVEAHLMLTPPDQNPPPSDEIMARARSWGQSGEGLEPADALLELTVNNAKDALLMFPGNLFDIGALAAKYGTPEFWQSVVERSVRWRWSTATKLTLAWVRELFSSPVPDGVLAALRAPAWRTAVARASLAFAGPKSWEDSTLPRGLGALLKMALVEDVTPIGYLRRRRAVISDPSEPEAA